MEKIKGGIRCEFEDCFAEQNMNCTLLRASYKGKDICPFYKSGEKNKKNVGRHRSEELRRKTH